MSAAASGTVSDGMAAKMGSSIGSSVVKNPIFFQSLAKGAWESIAGNEETASQQQQQQAQQQHRQQQQQPWIQQQQQQNRTQLPLEDNSINCSQEEYEAMQVAMKNLKWWYLGVASFMILTAFLSLTTLTVISSGFLAFYVLIFSCLMCCYELHWKVFTRFIVQNFGFMYNSPGRMSFTVFLGMLTWSLGALY
jgi:Flp pilus assembly protein TadB